jgi:ferredoxin
MFKDLIFINNTLNSVSKEITTSLEVCLKFLSKYDTCDRCINICPKEAISIDKEAKQFNINHSSCSHCGLCTNTCPTGVFEFKYTKFNDLLSLINQTISSYNNIIFACERFLEYTDLLDSPYLINIPCIGILDYSLLTHILLLNPQEFTIFSDCNKCINKKAYYYFFELYEEVTEFLSTFNKSNRQVSFKNKFIRTEVVINEEKPKKDNSCNLTRRELFKYYKNHLVSTTKKSLSLIKKEQSCLSGKIDIQNKRLPQRRTLFLNNMKKLEISESNKLLERSFSFLKSINIDYTQCNLCSICYILCPTGALTEKSEIDNNGIYRKKGITINHEKCINCNFCINICPKKAINYNNSIDLSNYKVIHD